MVELDGRAVHGTVQASRATGSAIGSCSPRVGARCGSPGVSCDDEPEEIAADLRSSAAVRDPYPLAMDRELFEHYLRDDSRRGPAADGAFTGAAGGAACGDLSRISLIVEDGRIAAVSFDAEGCGATSRATAAVAEMSTARRCSTPPGSASTRSKPRSAA